MHKSSRPLAQFAERACLYDPADTLLPFNVDGMLAGWMKRSFADYLAAWPEYFSIRARGIGMLGHFATAEHRSAALAEVVETLAQQEAIHGWRGEQLTVAETFYAPALFHIERAASRYFGLTVYAAHLNGLTERDGELKMWLARRADSKAIDPGKLDNMTAGRIARGYSPRQTLAKEAWEEAGVTADQVAQAHACGALRCKYLVDEGLHHEIMFVHDLLLNANFEPQNQDGEVAEFSCHPITEVLQMLETPAQFTVDAALVIIDCLIRRGIIGPERDDYLELIHAMRP
jgi:8-oxo-dGTP pyrophosphatase MutT (NUDIX family)